jgi:diguanylate cyclase (GGDEF)-like protein
MNKPKTMQSLTNNKYKLVILLITIISVGFLFTTLQSYFTSVRSIKNAIIINELPLTSDNIFSAIQRDLIKPTLVSSMIANDTFLHDWTIGGEKNINEITQYLSQIKKRYQATTSFFISERTHHYYYADGLLKTISKSDAHDGWYFHLAQSKKHYETIVDTDQAYKNQLTIFINYKVLGKDQTFLGVGGLGLTVHGVSKLVDEYQQKFQRAIYFVNRDGDVVLTGNQYQAKAKSIYKIAGLKEIAKEILLNKKELYEYSGVDGNLLLSVRYLPELDWYVFVEKNIDNATMDIRHTLYLNLSICALSIVLMSFLMHKIVGQYHGQVEKLAVSDSLTGLPNRMSLELMAKNAINEAKRKSEALSLLLIDVDYFKQVNDRYGHLAGDEVLRHLSATLKKCLRESDYICRWGGEEFLVLLKGCNAVNAHQLAEKIRLVVAQQVVMFQGSEIETTISLGVSEWAKDETFEQLVHRADLALIHAKNTGRNQSVVM